MNFKPVVASIFALGMVSAPAMAAKHVENHAHRGVTTTRPLLHDYVTSEALVSYNNAKSPVNAHRWTRRIHMSGMVNVDARYAARGPLGIVPLFLMSDNTHELNVNNANLFVDAHINSCVSAHVGLAYVEDSVNNFDTGLRTSAMFTELTKQVRSDRGSVFAGGEVSVDEAYISIDDFANSPMFFRVGKMYTSFGAYHNPYPVTYSLTQLFSQLRATTVELGMVTSYGFYGSVYVFDGAQSSVNFSDEKFDADQNNDGTVIPGIVDQHIPYTRINNWGMRVGYHGETACFDYHVNASFIKDLRDVNYLADIQDLVRFTFVGEGQSNKFDSGFAMRQTGGFALHADVNWGQWAFSGDYVSALRNMIRDSGQNAGSESSTRIWAGDITGRYNTNFMGYPSFVSLSYQRSGQAAGIAPELRYSGQVSAEIYPHTHLTFEFTHNRDYDRGEDGFCHFINGIGGAGAPGQVCGGTGRNNSEATLRLGVVF